MVRFAMVRFANHKPTMGVEPITYRLQSGRSAIELRRPDDKNAPVAAPGDYTKPAIDESISIHRGVSIQMLLKLLAPRVRPDMRAVEPHREQWIPLRRH